MAYFQAFELNAYHVAARSFRGRILDLGCNDGTFGRMLKELLGFKGKLIGIDISEDKLRRAARVPSVYFKVLGPDASELPFKAALTSSSSGVSTVSAVFPYGHKGATCWNVLLEPHFRSRSSRFALRPFAYSNKTSKSSLRLFNAKDHKSNQPLQIYPIALNISPYFAVFPLACLSAFCR